MTVFRLLFLLLFIGCTQAQKSIGETLSRYNKGSVPYISTAELAKADHTGILDTRAWKEYQVSHLQKSLWVGYDEFKIAQVQKVFPDKDTPLVVYCSVGVRSEDIGEKLMGAGYTHVRNLYGGIFQWKIDGYPVFNTMGQQTSKVHAYSKQWGELLTNAEKVY